METVNSVSTNLIAAASVDRPQPEKAKEILGPDLYARILAVKDKVSGFLSVLECLSDFRIDELTKARLLDSKLLFAKGWKEFYTFLSEFIEGKRLTDPKIPLTLPKPPKQRQNPTEEEQFYNDHLIPLYDALLVRLKELKDNPSSEFRTLLSQTPLENLFSDGNVPGMDRLAGALNKLVAPTSLTLRGILTGYQALKDQLEATLFQNALLCQTLAEFFELYPTVSQTTRSSCGDQAFPLIQQIESCLKLQYKRLKTVDSAAMGQVRRGGNFFQKKLKTCLPPEANKPRKRFFAQYGKYWKEIADIWIEACQWAEQRCDQQLPLLHTLKCVPLFFLQNQTAKLNKAQCATQFQLFCSQHPTAKDLVPLQMPLIGKTSTVSSEVREKYKALQNRFRLLEETLSLTRTILLVSRMGAVAYLRAFEKVETKLSEEACRELEQDNVEVAKKAEKETSKELPELSEEPEQDPQPDSPISPAPAPTITVTSLAPAVPPPPLSQLMGESLDIWESARLKLCNAFARCSLQNAQKHHQRFLLELTELTPSLPVDQAAELLTSALIELSLLQEQLLTSQLLECEKPTSRIDCLEHFRHYQSQLRQKLEGRVKLLPSAESIKELDKIGRRSRRLFGTPRDGTPRKGVALLHRFEQLQRGQLKEPWAFIQKSWQFMESHLMELMQAVGDTNLWKKSWRAFSESVLNGEMRESAKKELPAAVQAQINAIEQLEKQIRKALPGAPLTGTAAMGYKVPTYNYLANASRNLALLKARWTRSASSSYQNCYDRTCVLITLTVKQLAVALEAKLKKIDLFKVSTEELPHDLRDWVDECGLTDLISDSQWKFLMKSAYVHRVAETPYLLIQRVPKEAKNQLTRAIKAEKLSVHAALGSKTQSVELKEDEVGFSSVASRHTLQRERSQRDTLASCLEISSAGLEVANLFWKRYQA